MLLDSITLQQFRNYRKQAFSVSPRTTLIIGPNAVGKTNILESIYALATGKSFRAKQDREMIAWSQELGRITGVVGDTTLELVMTLGQVNNVKTPFKRYLVNGVPRRQIDFIGNARAVLFWPEDLELVTDSPSVRRNYLDSVLVQVDREYRRNLLSYEKGVRQRNKLLERINEGFATRSQLLFWNQLLIKAGGYLTDKRADYISYVNETRTAELPYRLVYDKSVISETRLEQYAEEEVAAKVTLVGPHRDNFQFLKLLHVTGDMPHETNERDLSQYGSRGEQRLSIVWLKLAELSFIQKMVGERPILLLDDIFSELDMVHQELVLDLVGRQQTVITSASEDTQKLLEKEHGVAVTVIRLPINTKIT